MSPDQNAATVVRPDLLRRDSVLLREATAGKAAGFPLETQLVATLHRLLAEAVSTGSDRVVVKTFIDALAVWLDLEVRGYIADIEQRYTLAVALPGSDPAAAPAAFELIPGFSGPVWRGQTASARGAHAVGSGGDSVLVPIRGRHAAPWLLAISRDTPIHVIAEMGPYVDILAHALDEVAALDTSRLMWSVIQQFVQNARSRSTVHEAIEHVSTSLGAAVSLSVTTKDGRSVLAEGETTDILVTDLTMATANLIVVRVDVPEGYAAALAVRAPAGRSLTLNDVRKLEAIAGVCGAGLAPILRAGDHGVERRSRALSFVEAIERHARDAASRDEHISVIVIAVPKSCRAVQGMHGWIGRIREALRPTDLAARLSAYEVGVLLLDTPNEGARLVQQRLLRLLSASPAADAFAGASVGIASSEPGGDGSDSLLRRARASALCSHTPSN